MRIGIDVSQLAYPNTGVARYLENLVEHVLKFDHENEYVLFFSSLRRQFPISNFQFPVNKKNVKIKTFKIPPFLLDILWNRLHIAPIEWFVGDVDLFITSDWVEPPARSALKATVIYDMIIYKYPKETDQQITDVQKRKLRWVREESGFAICISESTRQDAHKILGIPLEKMKVIYPAIG